MTILSLVSMWLIAGICAPPFINSANRAKCYFCISWFELGNWGKVAQDYPAWFQSALSDSLVIVQFSPTGVCTGILKAIKICHNDFLLCLLYVLSWRIDGGEEKLWVFFKSTFATHLKYLTNTQSVLRLSGPEERGDGDCSTQFQPQWRCSSLGQGHQDERWT